MARGIARDYRLISILESKWQFARVQTSWLSINPRSEDGNARKQEGGNQIIRPIITNQARYTVSVAPVARKMTNVFTSRGGEGN